MNNIRNSRNPQRKAIDGFFGAPSRPQLTGKPFGDRGLNSDTFKTTSRTIGDFKQPAGYHQINKPVTIGKKTEQIAPKKTEAAIPSLNMTLPGEGSKKGKTKKKRVGRWRKRLLWGSAAIVLIFVLITGFLFAKGYLKLHKVFKGGGSAVALRNNVDPTLLKGEGDGRVNILLLGRGGDGHDGADLTDTILLVSIDPVNKKTALVSLPRDLWVSTRGSSSKINAVFANAKDYAIYQGKTPKQAQEIGIKAMEDEVTSVTGVKINYYGLIDFAAFQKAIDTVGGVTINVPETLSDYTMAWQNGNSPILARKGMQTFDGRRALMYVRSRHGSARGDFDRAERQRLLLEALSKKILSAGTYSNPAKISQLLDAFGDHISTDLSVNDGMALMRLGKQINGNFESIDLADPAKPFVTTGMVGNQSVVVPVAGISDFSELKTFLQSKLKDGYILKENANISVLNGTSIVGLASSRGGELKNYGYNVTTVGDAPTKNYTKTTIVDLTNGKNPYTKNYLEKRFGVKAVKQLPDQTIPHTNVSFVIIIGQDATTN